MLGESMTVVGAQVIFHKMVFTPDKQMIQAVLLYKRSHDAPIHPGYWALFGGRLKKCEETIVGLKREIREELKARTLEEALQTLTHLTNVTIRRSSQKLLISYFKASLTEEMNSLRLKRTNDKVEGEGLGWFTEEEIHHLWVRPEDRIALTKFFQG